MRAVRTIACVGQRRIPHDAARHVRAGVHEMADQYPGATWLVREGAGADRIATDELLARGERVELVLASTASAPGARFSMARTSARLHYAFAAAELHVMRDRYDPAAHHECVPWMLERADLLVAFWAGRARGSGTARAVRLADERGLPMYYYLMA